MSLYFLQKVLYDINRSEAVQQACLNNIEKLLNDYDLSEQERAAIINVDIGLLYVLGVNGQILMHFAAFHQILWDDYLGLMKKGIEIHGPVRAGVYAMVGGGQSYTEDNTSQSSISKERIV